MHESVCDTFLVPLCSGSPTVPSPKHCPLTIDGHASPRPHSDRNGWSSTPLDVLPCSVHHPEGGSQPSRGCCHCSAVRHIFRNYATLHLPSAKSEPSLSFFQHLATRVQSEHVTATSSLLALNQVEVVPLNEGCGTKRWQRAANTPSTCRQAWTKNAWPELKTSMPWESLLHPLVITRLTMHVATCNAAAKPGSATGQSKP